MWTRYGVRGESICHKNYYEKLNYDGKFEMSENLYGPLFGLAKIGCSLISAQAPNESALKRFRRNYCFTQYLLVVSGG